MLAALTEKIKTIIILRWVKFPVKFCVCKGPAHIFSSTLVGFFNQTGTISYIKTFSICQAELVLVHIVHFEQIPA